MALSLSGTTGIVTGNIAALQVTTATIADANITAAKLNGAQSGSAPIYGARAWVNYNGSNNSIRASGNVTSVTDNGTGLFRVNFNVAMSDQEYNLTCSGMRPNFVDPGIVGNAGSSPIQTTYTDIACHTDGGSKEDFPIVCVTITR